MTHGAAALRRNLRSTLAALVGLVIAFCLSTVVIPPLGPAHSGGKATIPLVREFTLAPSQPGWTAAVSVVDFDGGGQLPRADVRLEGGGLAKSTPMVETAAAGTYRLSLPTARPGEIRLTLWIRTLPGGDPVEDFVDLYTRTLVRGETLHVVGASPAVPSDDGADAGMFVAGAGALLIVAVICSLLAIRSRPPATARGR